MKQLIKDRKFLITTLSLTIICIFTLTIAYSALNAVLTIQGNAEITASTWDIHLENPVVKSGSATTEVPTITSGKTLTFNTTLNMPGDFYEFTVDVVNNGSIDAMIENVTKTPELTADQAKYLKYEVSYANGESISIKQNIAAGVTMPIKVRVEYRSDLSNGDLPTGQVVLNLSLVLDYIQSDGTGSTVTNNGAKVVSASGDITQQGTVVTIGSEQFYTIGVDGNNIKMLSKMNITLDDNPIQSSTAETTPYNIFKGDSSLKYSNYSGSLIEGYVNNYESTLELYGIEVANARIITTDELDGIKKEKCDTVCNDIPDKGYVCYDANCRYELPEWAYSTAYWTSTAYDKVTLFTVNTNGSYSETEYLDNLGVRPLITISKDYFN